MIIEHQPGVGITLGNVFLPWGCRRAEVRTRIGARFEERDRVHRIGEHLPGAGDIVERKDRYHRSLGRGTSLILGYDPDDRLIELELHEGREFEVGDVTILMGSDIRNLIADLERRHYEPVRLEGSSENVLVPQWLTVFASSGHLGGEGPSIAYVYCGRNIDHLMDAGS